ncbi:Abi family protein [Lacticaseibacillus jixiensis]|uniref:Abi family protein n=1 Tax=Lacticaseibacillus jixiensis TaxID=3231926 RepID=UPI0036F44A80
MTENNEKFDKPFVDIPDLLSLLQSRGVKVTHPDVAAGLLRDYGYYGLVNGFKRGFLTSESTHDSEIYEAGTSLLDMASHYLIDSQFQQLFLTSLFPIENQFRTLIGYEVGKEFGVNNYGPNDPHNPDPSVPSYLDVNNYTGKTRNSVIEYIRSHVLTSLDDPTAYYREKHNHIPPWIMMSNMMLGTAVKYYRILPVQQRVNIAHALLPASIGTNEQVLVANVLSAMDALRQFRNSAAHSSPMYLNKVNYKRNALSEPSKKFFSKFVGKDVFRGLKGFCGINDLFAALFFIIVLTPQPARRIAFMFQLKELERQNDTNTLRDNYQKYLNQAGLPIDYIARLELAMNNLQ